MKGRDGDGGGGNLQETWRKKSKFLGCNAEEVSAQCALQHSQLAVS